MSAGQGAAAKGKQLVAAAVHVGNGQLAEMTVFAVQDGKVRKLVQFIMKQMWPQQPSRSMLIGNAQGCSCNCS